MTKVIGTVIAVSVALVLGLLGTSVSARTVEPDRSDCGSALSVLDRDGGYQGGEMRADQAAFDKRCVDAAQERLRFAAFPAAIGGGLIAFLVISHALGPRRRRRELVVSPFGD